MRRSWRLITFALTAAVCITSCARANAINECGAFLETYDPMQATSAELARARALVEKHQRTSATPCQDLWMLVDRRAKEDESLEKAVTRFTPFGADVGVVKDCVRECGARTGEFSCIEKCGCARDRIKAARSPSESFEGTFSCTDASALACAKGCKAENRRAERDEALFACARGCAETAGLAAGEALRAKAEAERAARKALEETCCPTVGGRMVGDACQAKKRAWLATCIETQGERSKPTAKECCTGCGGEATAEGCNADAASDRCFAGCLDSIR